MTTSSSYSPLPIYLQYRTLTHTYLFKTQDKQAPVLKIYDLFRCRLFKTTLKDVPTLSLTPTTDPLSLLKTLIQKNLLPTPYQLPQPQDTSRQTLQTCLQDLQQLIFQLKPKIVIQSKDLEKFCCPITLEVYKDPVIDNHGHTFEKSAIEQHLKINKTCPISREPLITLTPNRAIQQAIEETQKQDPLPTFTLFKKSLPQLAQNNLKMVQDYIAAEEYEEALNSYTKALQYTKDWKDYQDLPLLFEKLQQKDHAFLAYLHLALYQLHDNKIPEALQTLQLCNSKHPDTLSLYSLLSKLYQATQHPETLTFTLKAAQLLEKTHPQEALALYQFLITQDPTQGDAYLPLATLITDPLEKSHLLLKGACHALQAQNLLLAKDLCLAAAIHHQENFVDRLVDLQLFRLQGILPHESLLELAGYYDKKKLFPDMIKAYRLLTQLCYNPTYYDKIISGYHQLQQPAKALQWTLSHLTLLIEKEQYAKAETLALAALKSTPDKISLYNHLETLYTHWHSHELSHLWSQLGKAYQEQGQLSSAEKTYRKAFERFHSFEHAALLAETLIQQGETASGVQTYYQASVTALLGDSLPQLEFCVTHIRKADPLMEHLDLHQKIHILTQNQLLKLSQELKGTQEELRLLKKQVKLSVVSLPLPTIPSHSPQVNSSAIALPLPGIAFGADKWAQYIGNVGAEPPLPANIAQILESPCPIWSGKKVRETHLLTLIPQTVNGQPLTLKLLGELVQKPLKGTATKYRSFTLGEYKDPAAPTSHWVLMSRDVIPGSRSKSYADQQALVASTAQKAQAPYQVPNVLDASVSIFMEYVHSGTCLYNDSPYTYTRCHEKYNANWQLVVGRFALAGLYVHYDYCAAPEYDGIGVLRKFS